MKKFLIIFLSISHVMLCQESPNVTPWAKQASMIHVRITDLYMQVPITDATNAMDVKKYIRGYYGVPTEHQTLTPYWKRWWLLWLSEGHGVSLKNIENIKRIMSVQNTDLFEIKDTRKYPHAGS